MCFSFFPQYPFELGLMAAFVFSTLVCLSRLYTGMHTVLVSHAALSPAVPCPRHARGAALAARPPVTGDSPRPCHCGNM